MSQEWGHGWGHDRHGDTLGDMTGVGTHSGTCLGTLQGWGTHGDVHRARMGTRTLHGQHGDKMGTGMGCAMHVPTHTSVSQCHWHPHAHPQCPPAGGHPPMSHMHPKVPMYPPDPGVPTGHLMRPDFGHQDADDAHKHHEVHLGMVTLALTPPAVGTLPQDDHPRAVSPTTTAIRMGQRMIHHTAAFSFLSQHLPEFGGGWGALSQMPGSLVGDIRVSPGCDKMGRGGLSGSLTPRSHRGTSPPPMVPRRARELLEGWGQGWGGDAEARGDTGGTWGWAHPSRGGGRQGGSARRRRLRAPGACGGRVPRPAATRS